MGKRLAASVCVLSITVLASFGAMACGGGPAQEREAPDQSPAEAGSGSEAAASAGASESSGEFMGQPTSHWVEQLADGADGAERTRAVAALASIGPVSSDVTNALVAALVDDEALVRIGVGVWDTTDTTIHYLFPAEWYDHIPAGYEIVDISERVEAFEPGKTDDDRRGGMLAYGWIREITPCAN